MKLELKARSTELNTEEVETPIQEQGGEPADPEYRVDTERELVAVAAQKNAMLVSRDRKSVV